MQNYLEHAKSYTQVPLRTAALDQWKSAGLQINRFLVGASLEALGNMVNFDWRTLFNLSNIIHERQHEISTMWYVRPAMAQTSLGIHTV